MHKAYIYPVTKRFKSEIYNPYIDNFISYNSNNFLFLNKNNPSNSGIFNILKYITQIDTVFFNWIEKIPDFKGGFFQSIFLVILLNFCKIKGIRIVWTVHNKISHSKDHLWLKKYIFKTLMKKSDLIITHSREGKSLVTSYGTSLKHVFYFPHPVINSPVFENEKKEFDILIWGSLVQYKGIDLFLENIFKNNLQEKYAIKIIGKCYDTGYLKKLMAYSNYKINIEDKFLNNNDLGRLMSSSRIVLFTYSSDSILSSGALAESVACGAMVVGPNKASFSDLSDLGYIFVYDDFSSLIKLVDDILAGNKTLPKENYKKFQKEFHWSEFASKLFQEFN
jgi:glycosyltransferase involved in cell wall biosynthesis